MGSRNRGYIVENRFFLKCDRILLDDDFKKEELLERQSLHVNDQIEHEECCAGTAE